jgi:hypothetical protein
MAIRWPLVLFRVRYYMTVYLIVRGSIPRNPVSGVDQHGVLGQAVRARQ